MGTSGSVRVKSLDASALGAMQDHELRRDLSGRRRRVREVDPLVYSPHGQQLDLKGSYEAHVVGAKRSRGATKLCLHAFVQFPTDIEVTPDAERMMLREAAAFIDRHHGGRAVFRARLDRDEAGRHGVDVFYAPRYEKRTKRRSAEWVSLTRFGKDVARARFGQRPVVDKGTGEPVAGPDGAPKLMWNDSSYFQGRALQDLWFEHLKGELGLDWAVRGERKVGRDPDRLEPEEYKLQQERAKLDRQREADVADAVARNRIIERSGEAAIKARDRIMTKAREREDCSRERVADLEDQAASLERRVKGLQDAVRASQEAEERVEALQVREEALRASVARSERLSAEVSRLEGRRDELAMREGAAAAKETDLARREKELAREAAWTARAMGNLRVAVDHAMSGRHLEEIAAEDMADRPREFATLQRAAPEGRATWGFRAEFWALNFSDSGEPAPLPEAVREAGRRAFAKVAAFARERLGLFEAAKAQALTAAAPEVEAARRRARDEGLREAEAEAERARREAEDRAADIARRERRFEERAGRELGDRERFFEDGFAMLTTALRKAFTPDEYARAERAYADELRERDARRRHERRPPRPEPPSSSYSP